MSKVRSLPTSAPSCATRRCSGRVEAPYRRLAHRWSGEWPPDIFSLGVGGQAGRAGYRRRRAVRYLHTASAPVASFLFGRGSKFRHEPVVDLNVTVLNTGTYGVRQVASIVLRHGLVARSAREADFSLRLLSELSSSAFTLAIARFQVRTAGAPYAVARAEPRRPT